MKSAIFFMVFSTLLSGAAEAQVRKCIEPDGKVTYSDFVCNGGTITESNVRINPNMLDNSNLRRQANQERRRQEQEQYQSEMRASMTNGNTAVIGSCPSEQEIRNMETSVSSITYRDRIKERDFLQAEIRRARACSKEGGNYSKEDWKRVKEGQQAQGNITADSRRSGRDSAEGIHSSAASDREQERMRIDKLIEAEREFRRRAYLPIK